VGPAPESPVAAQPDDPFDGLDVDAEEPLPF
jgi:hypothetical protein